MTRGMCLFFGGALVVVGLIYLAVVIAGTLDRGDLQRSGVEIEGEVLRVQEGVGYEGTHRTEQVRRCTADVRVDVEGRTYQPRVALTRGECDTVRAGQRLTVVFRASEPSYARRTFDPAVAGENIFRTVLSWVFIVGLLAGGVVLLVRSRTAPYR